MYEQCYNGTNEYMNPFSHQPDQYASEIKEGTARNTQMAPREVKPPPGDMFQGCTGHYQAPNLVESTDGQGDSHTYPP